MASLRNIKKRIAAVKKVSQVTRAMKMVAAARLKKAQEKLFNSRPYIYKTKEIIQDLIPKLDETSFSNLLTEFKDAEKELIIFITADRGLCGSFNANLIRKLTHILKEKDKNKIDLIFIGKSGYNFFKNKKVNIKDKFLDAFTNVNYMEAEKIAQYVINQYLTKQYKSVFVLYNEFKTVMSQNIILEKILPLKREEFKETKSDIDYIYEPDKEAVFIHLLEKYFKVYFYGCLIESYSAEQGARMTAMESATKNAGEIIDKLTIIFNRTRQAIITKEISEIVGSAEALK